LGFSKESRNSKKSLGSRGEGEEGLGQIKQNINCNPQEILEKTLRFRVRV